MLRVILLVQREKQMDTPTLRAIILFFSRRLVWLILTFLVMTVIIFAFMQLETERLIYDKSIPPTVIKQLKQYHALDQPIWTQYTRYLGNALRGEYGPSLRTKRSVAEIIDERSPTTRRLLGLAILVGTVLSGLIILLGSLTLWLRGKIFVLSVLLQRVGQIGLTPAVAIPTFLLGLFLLYLFGLKLHWLPVVGWTEIGSSGGFSLKHAVLPVLALAVLPAYLVTRSVLGEIAHYRAKAIEQRGPFLLHIGLSFFRYGLIQLIGMLGGALFVELIFSLPGAGYLFVNAIHTRDYTMLVGSVSTFLIWALVIRLVADVVQGIDGFILPRLQMTASEPEAATSSGVPPYAKTLSIIWIALCALLVIIPLLQGIGGILTDSDALLKTNIRNINAPPGTEASDGTVYAWGTDHLGRDMQRRVRYALGITLLTALLINMAILIPALVGGLLAGYLTQKDKLWADLVGDVVVFPVEVLTSIPGVVLLAFILAVVGPGLGSLLTWLALVFLLPRSMRMSQNGWVATAPKKAVWFRVIGISLGVLVLGIGLAVVTQPALSFVGLGAVPPFPDIGITLSEGRNQILANPQVVLRTGLALFFAAFGWFLLGDTILSKFGLHRREGWLELNR
jgi:ABC-type dipeptide/oligopeptide/nickel transport system permease component/ABC-type dipeptide/oligopeptide/nickel transport system permease subunit